MSAPGTIHSLNVSAGGVPKLPVALAHVTRHGLAGDRQRNLKYHGGPDRALCLYAHELVAALRAEGHPVGVGSLGENVTVRGVAWDAVAPGTRFVLGDAVLIEVTSFTPPCRTISRFFLEGRAGRVSERTHPGWSRVYARVLEEGVVRVGDPVRVVPAGAGAIGPVGALER